MLFSIKKHSMPPLPWTKLNTRCLVTSQASRTHLMPLRRYHSNLFYSYFFPNTFPISGLISIRRTHAQRPLKERLNESWSNTKVIWYPIPIGLGLAFIAFQQYLHLRKKDKDISKDDKTEANIIVAGPWQVHVAAALPLRTISRLWGKFNNMEIPEFLRPAGFKLYSFIFGCNLEEMKVQDLKAYPNLGSFFCRELKEGVRPIENEILVSPADGQVLHLGIVEERKIEQIKGKSYSLDALIGQEGKGKTITQEFATSGSENIVDEEEFANMNGITYSLDSLVGEDVSQLKNDVNTHFGKTKVGMALLPKDKLDHPLTEKKKNEFDEGELLVSKEQTRTGNRLYFCVVYLAPGDYHRFHTPTNWVVQTRRHFAGELFSVSPYMTKLLENLFVLNERVVLIGKWKYGFFSMIPVGATNVGSIKINFDEALKTNQKEELPSGSYTEVSYKSLNSVIGGKLLKEGEEIGGFYLGSTIVLIFEAPSNFKFKVTSGQRVQVGQALGDIEN